MNAVEISRELRIHHEPQVPFLTSHIQICPNVYHFTLANTELHLTFFDVFNQQREILLQLFILGLWFHHPKQLGVIHKFSHPLLSPSSRLNGNVIAKVFQLADLVGEGWEERGMFSN